MKCLVSWSSGKDSAWTVHVLRQRGIRPAAVLTTINAAFDRVAMHGVRRTLVETQAAALGLPLRLVPLPWPCSNAEYEARMSAVTAVAVADGFTHVAFGDLFLEDIRRYREQQLAGSGLTPIFPLFGSDTRALARELVDAGLRATLSCVDPRHLPAAFAGREFDDVLLAELPAAVDPCGERGEFHTFAYDGPMFAHAVPVSAAPPIERDGFVFADLTHA
jgi:uncharacterized protein (TIGR00290 family)